MFRSSALVAFTLVAVANAQQFATLTAENHPRISVQSCNANGSCQTQSRSVALDSNWRWLHNTDGYTNCYTGNEWDSEFCPDPQSCAQNCALDGADYTSTYGITTSGSELALTFVTNGQYSTNVGSRVYLMENDDSYQMFNLLNQEFTFDVDMSELGCGLNGALYFVQMDEDGGLSRFSGNQAGAKYGTGYCDTQCPHDIKFINGEANIEEWSGSPTDPNAGAGKYGACCNELDIWEANSMATAFTPHVCTGDGGQTRCEGIDCGDGDQRYDGICDKDGCDFNSYRMGEPNFLGPGKTVNTNQKITVVTQFLTHNNRTDGDLVEMRRLYVQNGRVIANSKTNIPGMEPYDSVSDEFCVSQKSVFEDNPSFMNRGGMKGMGEAFKKGMVLVLSIWADHAAHMLWLDSSYPTDADPNKPGITRGPCPTDSGDPEDVQNEQPDATVRFSNIKYGPIGSTY